MLVCTLIRVNHMFEACIPHSVPPEKDTALGACRVPESNCTLYHCCINATIELYHETQD